ncbi:MAG: TetR/AcrR family transcriptional regulator [Chitinophagales bacterium]|nr:TetR/AcrR family transcriptional regulator [Chitinophagales bacterium]MCO5279495.1 TetR/AcrR family transcriptional regulator [Chitinophagales bacterium]HRN94188.1 TetR/AcrR family transcriptional regulator [Chitinophagales bacterium]HRP39280.1 TetR/AcrR family transcriptional regulator [Chitinophagales bacterium]
MKSSENLVLLENLLKHAEMMFMKQGIKGLTMDDLAKEMGMSKKTIYALIRDKEHLVQEVMNYYVKKEVKTVEQIRKQAKNPIEEMVLIMSHVLQTTKELNPQVLFDMQKLYPKSWQIFHDYRNGYIFNFIHSNIEAGIKNDYYRSDIETDIITKFYLGAINVITDQALFPIKQYSFVALLQAYIQYHLRAIVSQKGLQELLQYKDIKV